MHFELSLVVQCPLVGTLYYGISHLIFLNYNFRCVTLRLLISCYFLISYVLYIGTPLDLSYSNISAIKVNGFSSSDLPPADLKQPAWKPYLYKGKQRMLFTIHKTVHAAMYD